MEKTTVVLHSVGDGVYMGVPVAIDPNVTSPYVGLDLPLWEEMEYPEVITVTIEAGDTLNTTRSEDLSRWRSEVRPNLLG